MSDDPTKTVRIQRPARVVQDERGRNVWVGKVETVELELMSSQMLERVLKSGDSQARSEIQNLAAGSEEGILARDTASGHYQIVSKDELKSTTAARELSLVSTQILRKTVKGGFDPYNKG
jgi:hypothetical protein